MHVDVVVAAANAKKHVLCEKPPAANPAELAAMFKACRDNGVQFMDGTMLSHGARIVAVKEALKGLGPVRRITSCFNFNGGPEFEAGNVRMQKQLEPYGCLGDVGWYCVRYMLHLLDGAEPTDITARKIKQTAEGVPLDFSAEMLFPGDVSASLYCSFIAADQSTMTVHCRDGFVTFDDFTLPFCNAELAASTRFTVSRNFCDSVAGQRYYSEKKETVEVAGESCFFQETQMMRRIAHIARTGAVEEQWFDLTEKTFAVVDRCLKASEQ
jgi:predicted dehydrogenase